MANEVEEYIKTVETDPKYSLEVDPENKYNMNEEQKLFIKNYIEVRNIEKAAKLSGIENEDALVLYNIYSSQMEIRRIFMAIYHRQFQTKLLTLDDIGSYLSSLIIDIDLPKADKLKTLDKLKVAQMLIDLHKLKDESLRQPEYIMSINIEDELKNLSVDGVKRLLYEANAKTDKIESDKKVIELENINKTLTPEEEAYVKSLPTEEILKILQNGNNENKKELEKEKEDEQI